MAHGTRPGAQISTLCRVRSNTASPMPATDISASGNPSRGDHSISAPDSDEQLSRSGRLLNRAEAVAAGDLHITTDFDRGARTTQTLVGFGLILGGIAFCLLSIVLSRYTVLGLKRYAAANLALLRGQ